HVAREEERGSLFFSGHRAAGGTLISLEVLEDIELHWRSSRSHGLGEVQEGSSAARTSFFLSGRIHPQDGPGKERWAGAPPSMSARRSTGQPFFLVCAMKPPDLRGTFLPLHLRTGG